ncbi:hypothetical protein BM1_08825 [Bipolaris maydis]|nr:hypothetical protein BM1_08825 [Bipolaris maydis]
MRPKKIKWAPLEDGTEDNEAHLLSAEEDDGLRARLRAREKPRLSVIKVIIFTLWTVAAFAVGHFTDPSWREAKWGSFENGFVEERVVAPADIFELTQTVFTGGVDFTPDGEEILGPSLYVGEPSPEIDAAWDAIIGGRTHYFSISKEEAVALWGKDAHRYKDRPQGGFTGTPLYRSLKTSDTMSSNFCHFPYRVARASWPARWNGTIAKPRFPH